METYVKVSDYSALPEDLNQSTIDHTTMCPEQPDQLPLAATKRKAKQETEPKAKKPKKTPIDESTLFPPQPLDLTLGVDGVGGNRALAWTEEMVTTFLDKAIEIRAAGTQLFKPPTGTLTNTGLLTLGKTMDDQYDLLISNNWSPKYLVSKLKKKLADFVFLI